jgi:spermidine synthase
MVVAVFVFSIALGSLAVSALPRVPEGLLSALLWLLLLLLVVLYLAVPELPYSAHVLRTLFQSVGPAFGAFHFAVFLALLALLVVPIGISGALLPLLFHQVRRDAGELGAAAGRLYAWNTLGSLAGALVGGYLLLLWLDLHHVWRLALVAVAASAALAAWRASGLPKAVAALLFAGSVVAVLLLPRWDPLRMTAGLFRSRTAEAMTYLGPDEFFAGRRRGDLVFYDDDPTSTAAVMRGTAARDGRPNLSLLVNGKSDGNLIGDYPTMALAALLPAWMAADDARAFVIGLGTGVTVGELAALDGVREIEVAEISQAVIDALPLFDPGNLGASRRPEVRLHRADAYRALLQGEGRFDVIASEPSNPWVTGVEMLYSVEFLTAARNRLAPGGVYAQWFHTYETDTATVEIVLRNFAHVFPQVSVWYALANDVLLLGSEGDPRTLDVAALEQRFERPDFRAGFARVGIESFAALLAHEVLPAGVVRPEALPGPLHTLRHPILSDHAARAFFLGGQAVLPRFATPAGAEIGRRNSLLRRHAAAPDGSLPEDALDAAATEACRVGRYAECATFVALWLRERPDSARLEERLAEVRRQDESAVTLGTEQLERIGRLFGDGREASDGAGTPAGRATAFARARAATQRFLRHFHHAAPFDRRSLKALWRRCHTKACEASRREFESRLGPLAPGGG